MSEKCLSKVFDDFFESINGKIETNTNYSIEKISYEMYLLTIAVPGYEKNNIRIGVKDDNLIIKGIINKLENINHNYLYNGFTRKSFENSFSLNNRLSIVAANLSNGLLHIILKDKLAISN